MSNQIVISSGAKVRALEGVLTGTSGIVNALGINVPSGIPQLDGSGKILVSQLPNSVMEYKGSWNAATNTPTLVNGTGNAGDVYLCEVAGTVDFGAGPITFAVGDQVIYSGAIWQRASGATGTVTSVAVTESGDALTITGSPITTSGTINIGFAGTSGQYVNGAGGLTTFPSLTGFVPYTGATANVDLGLNNLTANNVFGETSLNVKILPSGSVFSTGYSVLSSLAGKFTMAQEATAGNLKAFTFDFSAWATNTSRTYTLPELSGTLALLEGSQTFSGSKTFSVTTIQDAGIVLKNGVYPTPPTGYVGLSSNGSGISIVTRSGVTTYNNNLQFTSTSSNDYNFPNVTGVMAMLEGTQTFTGAKTFSLDILVNGLTIGRGSGAIGSNTAIGIGALPVNTTGTNNTALGNLSMQSNTTGYGNTSIGYNALSYNTTGFFNAAIGVNTLQSNTTGAYNNALGTAALISNTTGSNNTAVGQQSGESNTTGSNNTYIGRGSGFNITTGSNNTIIGAYTGTAALSNNIVLADGAGNVRYQWDGTNNVFGNPISGTTGSFASSGGSDTFAINHSSGSGIALNITKGGNGEGLYINKTSGTGNALTVIGSTSLTGALSGTSATFSGNLNLQGAVTRNINFYDNTNTNINAQIQYDQVASNSGQLLFGTNNAGTFATRLTIANTGAATFSNSLTTSDLSASFLSPSLGTNQTVFLELGKNIADTYNCGEMSFKFVSSGSSSNMVSLGFYGAGNKLNVLGNGNVGIGTSSPSGLLSLKAEVTNTPTLVFQNVSGGPNSAISNFTSAAQTLTILGTNMYIDSASNIVRFNTSYEGSGIMFDEGIIRLYTGTSGITPTSRMTISSAGVVTITGLGTGTVTATSGVLSAVSDMNLKIENGFIDNALEKVMQLKPRYYYWKEESGLPTDLRQLGFYAQEVNEALGEEAANTPKNENDKWGIYDRGMIAFLTAAIQELKAELDILKNK